MEWWMCQCLAASPCLWVEYSDEHDIPFREVECAGRRQWQSGRVQWTSALYLLRRYGPRSNHRRGGWRRLACLHTESDVGTSFLRCGCMQRGRKKPWALCFLHAPPQVIRRVGCSRGGSWHASAGFMTFLCCSHARARPQSNRFSQQRLSTRKVPRMGDDKQEEVQTLDEWKTLLTKDLLALKQLDGQDAFMRMRRSMKEQEIVHHCRPGQEKVWAIQISPCSKRHWDSMNGNGMSTHPKFDL